MELNEILSLCDHTLLSQSATWDEIKQTLDDAIVYSTASACIPPDFVSRAAEYANGRVKICTVIGFPNGYSKSEVKAYEASLAAADGADEIDMVINIGMLKEKRYSDLLAEINSVKAAVGDRILKVIIEACLLTEEEKIRVCEIVSASDADFIKTSTGFSTGGATPEDIALLSRHTVGKRVKAAGGIKTVSDAENFIALGASRLGTSRLVGIAKKQMENSGY